jgi:SSS family solute:Na+ symporter
LIEDQYGKEAKAISSLVIPVAWIGIIAAQIIGGAKVMNSFFGISYSWSVWIIGIIFIFYTTIGGQVSILKTDLYQSVIIVFGLGAIAIYLFVNDNNHLTNLTNLDFPFNTGFGATDLMILLLTHSTTYLVGPDIYTRLFCAKNEHVARKSALITAIILVPFAFLITYLGIYAAHKFPGYDLKQGSSLITVLTTVLPDWGIGILVAAVLSAVMSSASTTLLTSSVIVANAGSGKKSELSSLKKTKSIILLMGLLSILLALKITSIIQSLLFALTFFSGAFIIPVLAGLMGFTNNHRQCILSIISGGLIALCGKIMTITGEPLAGNMVILSAFVVNASVLFYKREMFRMN